MRRINTASIYPYVVPQGYVDMIVAPDGFIRTLGHGVYVMLVEELQKVCTNVQPEEIEKVGLSIDEAHDLALDNLEKLVDAKVDGENFGIDLHEVPGGKFILWSGHWLAASCILLPGLFPTARKALTTDDICVSIPQREVMVLFTRADRKFRDSMRELIRQNEENAPKQITWELFSLSPEGIKPFVEG
jgi:hypothetical protein